MRRLLLILLSVLALAVAPVPCVAATPVSVAGETEEVSFSKKELNSPMMRESEPQVMTEDGELPSAKPKSFFSRFWHWACGHPVLSLLLLSLLLSLVFYSIKRSIKYWV